MKSILTVIFVLFLFGCASVPLSKSDAISEQLVAQNMIATFTQLMPRGRTTIAIDDSELNSRYWRLLVSEGYAIRVAAITDDLVDNVLRVKKQINNGKHEYMLTFNDLILEREYAADKENVYPTSPMFITGAGTTIVELYDQAFKADHKDGYVSSVVMNPTKISDAATLKPNQLPFQSINTEINLPASQNTPKVALLDPSLRSIKRFRPKKIEPNNQKAVDAVAFDSSQNPFNRNMFDLKESNYQSLFENYDDIRESTIIFENDSFILGRENKKLVIELSGVINPDTDVVSVVGCSHGQTGEGIENSILAIARAHRVKEELMRAGVNSEQVLEEACYSKEYAAELGLPRRGVQIKIKRRKL